MRREHSMIYDQRLCFGVDDMKGSGPKFASITLGDAFHGLPSVNPPRTETFDITRMRKMLYGMLDILEGEWVESGHWMPPIKRHLPMKGYRNV